MHAASLEEQVLLELAFEIREAPLQELAEGRLARSVERRMACGEEQDRVRPRPIDEAAVHDLEGAAAALLEAS